jgi:hypothetical protein
MKRMACVACGLALLAAVALAILPAAAADKAVPNIKEIMSKLNKPSMLRPNLGQDLMEDEPDWDMIQTETKQFVELVEALGKNTPAKGDKASWDRLTKDYLDKAKAMDAAARRKDKQGALAAHQKLSGNDFCKRCHDAHRKDD